MAESFLQAGDEAAAAVAVAPRVALADIEAAIVARFDITGENALAGKAWTAIDGNFEVPKILGALRVLSICILVLRNGWTCIGKSAPASPENFDADLGRKLAYDDAVRQLWPLMGFALRDKLAEVQGR